MGIIPDLQHKNTLFYSFSCSASINGHMLSHDTFFTYFW